MLCHKISLTMKHKNSTNYRRCHHRQFLNILQLSILCTILFTETMARPNLQSLLSDNLLYDLVEPQAQPREQQRQQEQQQQQQQQQQHIFSDSLTNMNGRKFLKKLHKYHHNQPNYLSKWPGLRDLVLTLDYDDDTGLEKSNDFWNTKFLEHLQQFASSQSTNYDNDIQYDMSVDSPMSSHRMQLSGSLSSNQLPFKDHNTKKNVQFHKQYMSPCHFKICNMGRKRDARFFKNN